MGSLVEHTRLLLLSQSATHKLARLLLRWCEHHGKRTADGMRIDAGLTHEEIGQLICSSRETVTRALAEFKRKHLISLAGSSIFVNNRKALEAMVRGVETTAV
jgi:CRP/FNR family transcriptional regulator, cyclic AMP receptor protein